MGQQCLFNIIAICLTSCPDGTHVERYRHLSRCDIFKLYFANDDIIRTYLDDKFDEAVGILDQYNEDIEKCLTKEDVTRMS